VPAVLNLIRAHDVVVIGMGLGAEEETKRAARRIIEDEASRRVVVDADGFYGLHLPLKMGEEVGDKFVIVTPHAGEFMKMELKGRGVKVPPDEPIEERINFVKDFSSTNRVTTLMKGPADIISNGVRAKQNKAGNAGMTVGGTGDVLAGVTGAFFAIVTDEPLKAATAAAFVNGAAGNIAFENKGFGLLATDVVENIPEVTRGVRW
ncbi:MAG: NAD(P)H-hydrate dehydratase, partial [Euryarchaeota archaeon]|nr:NAD(P)H-hydrate dehydratase [Euryarchaeota archaeon]